MKIPRALLIDLDGTLVDNISLFQMVYLQFLQEKGVKGSEDEFKTFYGTPIPEMVQTLIHRYQLPADVDEETERYHQHLETLYQALALRPGAQQVLQRAKILGLKLAIVTAAQTRLVETWLASNRCRDLFDAIVTSEGLPESKPHPAIYLKALEVVDVPALHSVAIEDSSQGALSALRAGIPTVILGEGCPLAELEQEGKMHLTYHVSEWRMLEALLF